MKKLYKIIAMAWTGLLLSCSGDQSSGRDLAGATTEPNSTQRAELTEEQKALLEKSLVVLVGGTIENSNDISVDPDQSVAIDSSVFGKLMFPFDSVPDTSFYTSSLDGSRSCQVSVQAKESGVELEQSMYTQDRYGQYYSSSIIAVKVVDVEGTPVLLKTVGHTDYWGYGTSCSEFLNEFKQSCEASNGIFKDYEDGCRNYFLSLVCSMLMPEGKTAEDIVRSYTKEYRNTCKEDSIKYAPVDTKVDPLQGCHITNDENGDHYFGDCPLIDDGVDKDVWRRDSAWRMNLTRTLDVYEEQFAVFREETDGKSGYISHEELDNEAVLAYNSFPKDKVANAYRKEGIFHLPDSLLAVFFPTAANHPRAYTTLQGEPKGMAYYIVVLKDIGAKGHALNKIDASGIYVRDILKSGESCPEDADEYYSVYLIRGSTEWDISEKNIVRSTFVSPFWNCDDSESIERIEPYGEWTNRDGF